MSRKGMLGALMDEYERASIDLKEILKHLSQEDFIIIRDDKTKDPDCKSIQTVMFHVVQSGYTYANYINTKGNGEWNEYKDKIPDPTTAISELNKMLSYTDHILSLHYDKPKKEIDSWSFKVRWGVTFDVEQLMEHAVVHILRHRRQIEHFLND